MKKYLKAILWFIKLKYYSLRFRLGITSGFALAIRAYASEGKKLGKTIERLMKTSTQCSVIFRNIAIVYSYEFIYGRYLYCSVMQDNAKWWNKRYWDKQYEKAKERYVQYLSEFSDNK